MSKVEEWGLKIEGLNVPMPPEQLAAKKKKINYARRPGILRAGGHGRAA